jgi:hypothetical protein
LTFPDISRGLHCDWKGSETPQIDANFIEVFDCFTKISRNFTFVRPGSPMDDFFDGSRTDGRMPDQSAVAFNGIAFILLDRGAIAAGFASESRGSIHLRRVIIQMGTLRFVRAIRSEDFPALLSRCSSFRERLRLSVLPVSVIANPFHQLK